MIIRTELRRPFEVFPSRRPFNSLRLWILRENEITPSLGPRACSPVPWKRGGSRSLRWLSRRRWTIFSTAAATNNDGDGN